MKNSNANSIEGIARKRNGVRPDYIVLGEDSEAVSYVYRTFDETVLVIQSGELVQRFNLDGCPVDDYVRSVRDEVNDRDWANRHYYANDENPFEVLARNIPTEGSA